jgi:hypothetical protein
MLLKEIDAVYAENHTKSLHTKCSRWLDVKADGTYSYQSAFTG